MPTKISGYGRPKTRFMRKRKRGKRYKNLGRCWNWTDAKVNGYAWIYANGRGRKASRYCWEIFVGPIPEGLCVLHKCDNPECVNPAHLFLGTNADNSQDMVNKGRQATQERHGTRTKPEKINRGSKHGMAKLSDDDVREIRRIYVKRSSEYGSYRLAERFGVSQHLIMCIVHRRNWKHLE